MSPIPFPNNGRVPILGQPCTVHGWFPTVMLTCNCGEHAPLLIVGLGAIAQCQSCRRGFVIGQLAHDPMTGAGVVQVVPVAVPAPAPEPAGSKA